MRRNQQIKRRVNETPLVSSDVHSFCPAIFSNKWGDLLLYFRSASHIDLPAIILCDGTYPGMVVFRLQQVGPKG